VLLDPRDILLKRATYHQDAPQWIWQLEHAPSALNREEAAWRLAGFSTDAVVAALEKAGTSDAFYGVRVEAAGSLGRIHTGVTRSALVKMLADKNIEVRASAANGLGAVPKSTELIDRLLEIARTDTSFTVRRAALIGAMRLKPDHGLDLVKPCLTMDSPHAEMQAAAVSAIQLLGDESAVGTLLEFSQSHEDRVRQAAWSALAVMGKNNKAVTDRLLEALDYEPDRPAAIQCMRMRGETAALPLLDRIAASDALPGVVRSAQSAAEAIRGRK
jgi:HEAT repeat protein